MKDGQSVTHEIADYIVGMTFADLPDQAVVNAKAAILDVVAVTLAAVDQPQARQILQFVAASGSGGDGRILGSSLRTSPELASLANGTLAHALDFDDRGHATTHTMGTILALLGSTEASGQDLLVAYCVGREIRMHLDETFDSGRFDTNNHTPGNHGWHATGTHGSLASAASAARILNLDLESTTHALGISASLASGVIANFGSMTKALHAGNAARNGVLSAQLAAQGWTAAPDPIASARGLIDALTGRWPALSAEVMVSSLRTSFHTAEKGVRIKPYPSCTGSHPYIEAGQHLAAALRDAIEHIDAIYVPRRPSLPCELPVNAVQTRFSGGFAVVAGMIAEQVGMDTYSESFLTRADVQGLMHSVQYVPSNGAPKIVVVLSDGQEFVEPLVAVRDLDDEDDRYGKVKALLVPLLGDSKTCELVEFVMDIDRRATASDLLDLVPPIY